MKLLITILLLFFAFSCQNNNNETNIIVEEKAKKEIKKTSKSIIFSENEYQIDTNVILQNLNLDTLLSELKSSELNEIKKVDQIPNSIKTFLDNITKESFSIANPGQEWQVGCVLTEGLPSRQLIYFGSNSELALMAYYTGGVGKSEHILIFKLNENIITDLWCGNILTDLKSKSEIETYLENNKRTTRRLNTNIIYL